MPRPRRIASATEAVAERAPADLDGALVGREEPARDPEQRRLPGPVLPDERVDLACAAVHAHLAYGLHRAEALGDAAQREHDGGRGSGSRRHQSRISCRGQFRVQCPPLPRGIHLRDELVRDERADRRLGRAARDAQVSSTSCPSSRSGTRSPAEASNPLSFIMSAVSDCADLPVPGRIRVEDLEVRVVRACPPRSRARARRSASSRPGRCATPAASKAGKAPSAIPPEYS